MTTPDIPRLRKIVEWAEEQEALDRSDRQWNQQIWLNECGTACCVAGKVVLDDGWKPIRDPLSGGLEVHKDGRRSDVVSVATQILGLTNSQAGQLFSPATGPPACAMSLSGLPGSDCEIQWKGTSDEIRS